MKTTKYDSRVGWQTGNTSNAISWSYHVIVAVGSDVGHPPWQVRWSGTCCLIISVIHRSASDLFDQHWRHSFSQCTGTRSAVEALCVMRYTSRHSSSLTQPHERRDKHTFQMWLMSYSRELSTKIALSGNPRHSSSEVCFVKLLDPISYRTQRKGR